MVHKLTFFLIMPSLLSRFNLKFATFPHFFLYITICVAHWRKIQRAKISPVHLPGRFLVPNKNVNPFQITEHESSCVEVKSSWPGGYDANLLLKSTVEVDHWSAQVIFNARFDKIDIFNGAHVQCSSSMCTFSDLGW